MHGFRVPLAKASRSGESQRVVGGFVHVSPTDRTERTERAAWETKVVGDVQETCGVQRRAHGVACAWHRGETDVRIWCR